MDARRAGVLLVVVTLAPVVVAAVIGFAALAKVELHTTAPGAVVAIACVGHHHSLGLMFFLSTTHEARFVL